MYKFKAIDYRLSRQEYIFSLISMLDENNYDFVYIPYAEYPALLMLDYILATNPHEFNADLFNYFQEAGKSERFGNKDILIISEDLVDRDGVINKLGISVKDTYRSQMLEQINLGRKQIVDKGFILDINTGEGRHRSGSISRQGGQGASVIREMVFDSIRSFTRENEALAAILDVDRLDYRQNELEGDLLTSKILSREILSGELASLIQARRVDFNIGVIHDITDMEIEYRGGKLAGIVGYSRKNTFEAIPHENILAETINQHEGLISELSLYTRDYLFIDFIPTIEGTRKDFFLGSINDYTLGERVSYIKGEIVNDYILSSRVLELDGYVNDDLADFDKNLYTDIVNPLSGVRSYEWQGFIDDIESFDKENSLDLISIEIADREGGGEGYIDTPIFSNKEIDQDVVLEGGLTGSSIEKIANIESFYYSESEVERGVKLVDNIFSDLILGKTVVMLTHEYADKSTLEEVVLESAVLADKELGYGAVVDLSTLYGDYEGSGIGIIHYTSTSLKEIDDTGKLLLDVLGDIGKEGIKDDFYIRAINEGERITRLETFHLGDGDRDRISILVPDVFTDKEKDFYYYTDTKEFVRELSSIGYISYSTDFTKGLKDTDTVASISYTRELQDTGILENITLTDKELGHEVVIDLVALYGDYGDDKYIYLMTDSFRGIRDEKTGELIIDVTIAEFDTGREGEIESPVYATVPKKKLLKSWLDGLERDGKKELTLEFYIDSLRDGGKDLEKIYADISERDTKKDLEKYYLDTSKRDITSDLKIYDELADGVIKRVNKLDKGLSIIDSSTPITERMNKDTTLIDGLRYNIEPMLKSDLSSYDYEKEAVVEYDEYFEKFKEAFIEEQVAGQSLMYDYSDILEEGMNVEHWEVGYAIPEDYDPLDPFNPYYPWAEERNSHSIVQEEEWEQVQGEWELDRGNAEIEAKEGGGLLVTKKTYGDFKFRFRTQIGYLPDSRTGFIFRYDDINNYYKFTISSGNNPFELIQVIDGRERKIASPIAPFFMDGGSWHVIDISLIEDRLVIYVDGRLQYDLILES